MRQYYKQWSVNNKDRINKIKKRYSDRIILFKGRRIDVGFNVRTGICSNCGKQATTHRHHWFYLIIMPWSCTQELCESCHTTKHWDNGKVHTPHKHKHIYYRKCNTIVKKMARIDKTQVQVHAETQQMLQSFVNEAYEKGMIFRPTYNEAIRYLLEKVKKK
jgi:hypothetical protein